MTDKYKGHTPGPWKWDFEDIDGDYEAYTCLMKGDKAVLEPGIDAIYVEDANARLIADAPTLLAENKRLRDALEGIVLYVKNGGGAIGVDREKRIHDTAKAALEEKIE